MSTDICLPRVSPDDAAVTLVKWHVAVGSRVKPGDVIAEIESDKAVVELEAEEGGVVTEIRVPEGSDDVRAEQVLAVLNDSDDGPGEPEDDTSTAPETSAKPGEPAQAGANHTESPERPAQASVGASLLANEAPETVQDSRASSLLQRPPLADEEPHARSGNGASPLATRMARQAGVDLAALHGSGPGGRILADDVRAILGEAPAARAHPTREQPVDGDTVLHGGFEPSFDIQAPDNMRRIIADRLVRSKREAPHFYMSLDCRADALLDLKRTLAGDSRDSKPSLNDIVLKLTATALTRVPALNAAWSEDGIRRFRRVDLAVAVALNGGLITPVIRGAEKKRIAEISAEMRDLVDRARAGQLARHEYQGGTFTVSNMGMHGVSHFTAVINPPQAAILAIGAASERPVAESGLVGTATVMTCTLSVDHRVADGVAAADFLAHFKRLAEDPRLLLL